MSFPSYPKYKESGVEWLGDVPGAWSVTCLKHLTMKIGSGVTPKGGAEAYVSEGVLLIRSQNVFDEGLQLDDAVFIDLKTDAEMLRTRIQGGDVLINLTGASLGRTCIVPLKFPAANVNQHVCIVRLRDRSLGSFISYALKARSTKLQIEAAQTGAAREGLNFWQIGKLHVTYPPSAEERNTIIKFLYRETAKIDALIEEQRRLIALLKEKRQAVISHVVTKGLDPYVPMKDSGLNWLGMVPASWTVSPLRYRYEVALGKMLDEKRNGHKEGFPYLRNVDVQWDRINFDDLPLMPFEGDESERYGLRQGDLLVCEGGELGRAAQMPGGMSGIYYQKALHRLRPLRENSDASRFMLYVLWDASARGRFVHGQNKATIGHLPAESLRAYVFAFPPLPEQERIISELDTYRIRSDRLICEAERVISLLQERRSALISAAVTGKIDVRNYKSKQTEVPEELYEPA